MSDRKALVGSALIFTFTNGLSAGIPFLMIPILTRVLSPEDYGKVAIYSVLVTVLGALTGLNVHGAVGIRYFNGDSASFPRYVASCLAILGISTAIVFCAVWLLLPWLTPMTKLPGSWLLGAVLVSCAQFVIQMQLAIWQFSQQAWRYGSLRLFQAIVDALLSLVLVLLVGLAWRGRLGGIAIATALSAVIALALMWRGRFIRFPASRAYAIHALRFGVPLVPHVVGGMLIALVDRFMISNLLNASSTGIYMVALQIGMVLGLATDSFNRAYAPWLIRSLDSHQPSRDKTIVRYTYVYFASVTLIALLLGALAPSLLGVLVGDKFRSAAPIVVYITMGFAFGGMYYMVANYIFFAGRTASLAAVTMSCGLINVGVCYLLLRRNGVVGAAQAFMAAEALLFVGTWWLANKSRPMPWLRAIWPARSA
jgi:O-antigen/teichoic acid export membrane protein